MSCALEVYDVVRHRPPGNKYTYIHTNLGYTHFATYGGVAGMLNAIAWQLRLIQGRKKMKVPFDSWLRDGPPPCITPKNAKERP